MNRLLCGALCGLALLASLPLNAASPPATPAGTRAVSGAITPSSFNFSSLPRRTDSAPVIVEHRRPEGIDPAAERELARLKQHPHVLTPADLGHVTLDRNDRPGGFAALPEGPLAPTVNNGFDGISQGPYIPSEPTVAAGPLNVFSAGNVSVTVTNKDGSSKVETDGATFFGVPAVEGAISDAQCYYDALHGRFVALAFTQGTTPSNYSNFYLAISKTNDARGAWWLYKFDMTKNGAAASTNWADYEALGVSEDKIAMTAQMFSFAADAYQYQKIRVLDRAAAYSGATLTYSDLFNFAAPPGGNSDDVFCTKAARNLTAGDATIHLFCVRTVGGTNVTYRTVTGPPSAPVLSAGTRITVAAYTPPPDAVQKNSAALVPTNDCRPTDFYVRNGVLICSWHTGANFGSGQVSALRLFRLRTSDQTVLTDETYGADGVFCYFPAVTVDSVGSIFLGFDRSSSTEFPSAYATGKRRGDASLQASALLKAGASATSQTRWGDYTGIDNDATASGPGGSVAWYAGQYTKATNTFGTWINKLTFTYGQIAGTVFDDCDGAPGTTADRTALAGVTVTLMQGANVVGTTVSDGSGNYAFGFLESGTYDVVVTPPGGGSAVAAIPGSGATSQTVVNAGDLQMVLTNAQSAVAENFAVATAHPVPVTTGISPASKTVNDAAFTMTVTGSSFTACSIVRLDGTDRATTFVNAGTLTAAIPATDMLAGGTHAITVFTPAPSGGTSNAQSFVVSGTPDTQAPAVTVTSPTGGESWAVGSSHPVTWTATDNVIVSSIDLAWSTDGGATFPNVIATAIPNSGTFNWTVPAVLTSTARVRAVAHDGANNIAADSSHANFAITGWTITASAGANGTIAPNGVTVVADGATPAYSITPNSGFHVADVLVNGVSVGAVTSYTFAAVHANQTIAASFAVDTWMLNVTTAGSGSVAKSPDQPSYNGGTVVQLTATPLAGWLFAGWSGDASGTANPLNVTMDADKNITATFVQHSYTWNASGSAAWGTAANWTPARTTPATDDVLIFTSGTSVTATGVPTQTIARLVIQNNTSVTFTATAAATLTIAGGTGTDFDLQSGSSLTMNGATAVTIAQAGGATGVVAGSISLSAAAHRLTAVDAGSLLFASGGRLTLGTGFSGNVFGTTNLNSVVFQSGSLLAQAAGANPFGATAPNSVVLFQGGSRFRLDQGASTPSMAGRTYADFEDNTTTVMNVTGGTALSVDSLIVSLGSLNLNLTGGVNIRGNVTVKAGATLGFNPASGTPAYTFSGSSTQAVNILGTFAATTNAGLVVNNFAGVTLLSNWTLPDTLKFVLGRITTGGNTLAIASTGSVTGAGSGSGWVAGRLRRTMASPTAARTFDVGDGAAYTPVAVTATGVGAAFDLVASTTSSDHPNLATSDLDPTKTVNRFWTLSPVGSPTFASATATFTFVPGDVDPAANPANFRVREYTGVWNSPAVGTQAPTSTQATGLTAFGDFAIGETATYTITASAGANGTITPSGAVPVAWGGSQSFAIAPNPGCRVADVLVDSVSVGAVTSYGFTNVTANHTIAASFADTTAPVVTVTAPNGGENLVVGSGAVLTWTASDNVGVTAIDLFLSRNGAVGPFDTLAVGLPNTGSYGWTVTGPVTATAVLRAVAHDGAGLTAIDASDNVFSIVGTTGVNDGPVTEFALSGVRPNPLHAGGHFGFALPRASAVRLSIMDVQGREVAVLAQGEYPAGRHDVAWANGAHGTLGAGIYFVRLKVAGRTFNHRFTLN